MMKAKPLRRDIMRVENIENAIYDILQTAEEFGADLARREAVVRSAMVDPMLWSLGWRTSLPWECQAEFTLGRYGSADYALFDPAGEVVVAMLIRPLPSRRKRDRVKLREHARTMTRGVAVLTYGLEWEVYDLEDCARSFLDRRVARLKLDHDAPNNVEQAAEALYQWLGRDRWW